jgi:periplasmic protein TonB
LPHVNGFALQSDLNASPSTLVAVVVAHVAAALLVMQLFEAGRYVEPAPLMVSLLSVAPEPQPHVASKPSPQVPVREVAREPVPEPVRLEPAKPEPAKLEPVREVSHEPKPIEHVVEPEPAPERSVEVPPPPLPQSMTEAPVPPPAPVAVAVPEPRPIAPAPAIAVAPEPHPIMPAPAPHPIAPAPVIAQAPQLPEDITLTTQMLTAIYLRNPKPLYPNLSRRLSEQGTVLLRVFVSVAGEATKIELKESSGFSRLDHAALAAVQAWKFVPAKKGEQPVAAWVVVPIKFSLKG